MQVHPGSIYGSLEAGWARFQAEQGGTAGGALSEDDHPSLKRSSPEQDLPGAKRQCSSLRCSGKKSCTAVVEDDEQEFDYDLTEAQTQIGASAANAAADSAVPHCRNDQLVSACTAAASRACRPAAAAQAFATAAELVSAPILMQQQQHDQACIDGQQDPAGPDPEEHAAPRSFGHADVGATRDAAGAPEPHAAAAAATAAGKTDADHPQGDGLHGGAAPAAGVRTRASAAGGLFATAKGKAIQISEAQRRKGQALLAQMDAAGAADPPLPPRQPQKTNTFRAPKPFNRPRPQPAGPPAPVQPPAPTTSCGIAGAAEGLYADGTAQNGRVPAAPGSVNENVPPALQQHKGLRPEDLNVPPDFFSQQGSGASTSSLAADSQPALQAAAADADQRPGLAVDPCQPAVPAAHATSESAGNPAAQPHLATLLDTRPDKPEQQPNTARAAAMPAASAAPMHLPEAQSPATKELAASPQTAGSSGKPGLHSGAAGCTAAAWTPQAVGRIRADGPTVMFDDGNFGDGDDSPTLAVAGTPPGAEPSQQEPLSTSCQTATGKALLSPPNRPAAASTALPPLTGFQTAAGKAAPPSASAAAVRKAASFFDDMPAQQPHQPPPDKYCTPMLHTDCNKPTASVEAQANAPTLQAAKAAVKPVATGFHSPMLAHEPVSLEAAAQPAPSNVLQQVSARQAAAALAGAVPSKKIFTPLRPLQENSNSAANTAAEDPADQRPAAAKPAIGRRGGLRTPPAGPKPTSGHRSTSSTPAKCHTAVHSLRSTLFSQVVASTGDMQTEAPGGPLPSTDDIQANPPTLRLAGAVVPCADGEAAPAATSAAPEDAAEGAELTSASAAAALYAAGADPAQATGEWVRHHLQMVLWKCSRYESAHPALAGRLVNGAVVLDQLKLRYEREVNQAQHSVLKRIMEHNDPPGRMMVLAVAALRPATQQAAPERGQLALQLVLTDGWYWIKATIDRPLATLVHQRRINVGDKLRICGAELESYAAGSPLHACNTARLKICRNNTFRVSRDERLGACKSAASSWVPLSAVCAEGGILSRTLVVLLRKYPKLCSVRLPDGRAITRTPAAAQRAAAAYTAAAARAREQAGIEVQQEEVARCRAILAAGRGSCSAGEHFYAAMHVAGEDAVSQEVGMAEQRCLQLYAQEQNSRMQQDADSRAMAALEAAGVSAAASDPHPYQQLLVGSVSHKGRPARPQTALLRVWRPSDELRAAREGDLLCVTRLTAFSRGGCRDRLLELSTGQGTQIRRYDAKKAVSLQWEYWPRQQLQLKDVLQPRFTSRHSPDCDYVGVAVHISEPQDELACKNTSFRKQWAFLADPSASASGATSAEGADDAKPSSAGDGGDAAAAPGEPADTPPRPWLLAVQLHAAPEALQFLDPNQHTGRVVAVRNLRLRQARPGLRLWDADATDVATIQAVSDKRPSEAEAAMWQWAKDHKAALQRWRKEVETEVLQAS